MVVLVFVTIGLFFSITGAGALSKEVKPACFVENIDDLSDRDKYPTGIFVRFRGKLNPQKMLLVQTEFEGGNKPGYMLSLQNNKSFVLYANSISETSLYILNNSIIAQQFMRKLYKPNLKNKPYTKEELYNDYLFISQEREYTGQLIDNSMMFCSSNDLDLFEKYKNTYHLPNPRNISIQSFSGVYIAVRIVQILLGGFFIFCGVFGFLKK